MTFECTEAVNQYGRKISKGRANNSDLGRSVGSDEMNVTFRLMFSFGNHILAGCNCQNEWRAGIYFRAASGNDAINAKANRLITGA